MRYLDIVGMAVPEVRMALRRATPDNTEVDEGYLEQCLFMVLAGIAEVHDLDAFTAFDALLFTTSVGDRTYDLPVDFGHFASFKEPLQTGIRVDNGSTKSDMYYEPLLDLTQGEALSNGQPKRFILTENGMFIDPAPDSNGGLNYQVYGTYVKSMDYSTFDMSQDVQVLYPNALREAVVARYLGTDMSVPMTRLINGEMRHKQQLQWSYHPQRWRRWRRKGRR